MEQEQQNLLRELARIARGPGGWYPEPLRHPSAADRRRAERLRAGLPALVRHRGGKHLLATPR
jgi:hypothetical protein